MSFPKHIIPTRGAGVIIRGLDVQNAVILARELWTLKKVNIEDEIEIPKECEIRDPKRKYPLGEKLYAPK